MNTAKSCFVRAQARRRVGPGEHVCEHDGEPNSLHLRRGRVVRRLHGGPAVLPRGLLPSRREQRTPELLRDLGPLKIPCT